MNLRSTIRRPRSLLVRVSALLVSLTACASAHADLMNCQGLYVGGIVVQRNSSLTCVVFLATPTATSGSYCTFFTNWTADDKKAALALLLYARATEQRVDVQTTASGNCGITTTQYDLQNVTLSTMP